MPSQFQPVKNTAPIPFTKNDFYHKFAADIKRGNKVHVMSRSSLEDFGINPRKWMLAPQKKTTAAMQDGTLIDTLLLSADTFAQTYAIAPEMYPCTPTKADPRTEKPWNYQAGFCKEWRDAKTAEGLLVCTKDDVSEADKAIKRIYEDPIIEQLLKHSDKQVFMQAEWYDEPSGLVIPFKALIDILPHAAGPCGTIVADFKRTANAQPDKWQRHTFDQDLYYQGALYIDIVNAVTGLEYKHFANVISESEPPYEPARRMFTSDYLQLGRMRYRRDLHLYCQCLKAGVWPGYDDMNLDQPNNPDLSAQKHPVIDGWRLVDSELWMTKKIAPEV